MQPNGKTFPSSINESSHTFHTNVNTHSLTLQLLSLPISLSDNAYASHVDFNIVLNNDNMNRAKCKVKTSSRMMRAGAKERAHAQFSNVENSAVEI